MDHGATVVNRDAGRLPASSTQAELAARQRAIIETSPDGFWMVDTGGHIVDSNFAYQQLSGYNRDELLQLTIADLEASENSIEVAAHIDRIVRLRYERFETRHRAKDGTIWPVEVNVSFWSGGGGLFFVFCRDISERLKAAQALRELSDSVNTIREHERARISRELHDELVQRLTGLNLDLSWLKQRLVSTSPNVTGKVDSMKQSIKGTVGAVQRISDELRPPILDNMGLHAAVDWLGDDFVERTGLAVMRDLDPAVDELPPDYAISVFRIVQECLTNTARHAQATTAGLALRKRDGVLRLRIDDDGKGMAGGDQPNTSGLGLVGIGERARLLGGTLAIESALGKGVNIAVDIPWPAAQAPAEPTP